MVDSVIKHHNRVAQEVLLCLLRIGVCLIIPGQTLASAQHVVDGIRLMDRYVQCHYRVTVKYLNISCLRSGERLVVPGQCAATLQVVRYRYRMIDRDRQIYYTVATRYNRGRSIACSSAARVSHTITVSPCIGLAGCDCRQVEDGICYKRQAQVSDRVATRRCSTRINNRVYR